MYNILWQMGRLSGCHQMPERSFFIKGKQFPVCARCTGVFIGYVFGIVFSLFFYLPVCINILFCLIMFADWLIQYIKIHNSNNIRRLITGTLCGFGLTQIYLQIIENLLRGLKF